MRWLVAAFALSATPLFGQRALPDAEVRGGFLAFDGRATLGDFTGTTTVVRGRMSGAETLQQVRGWVEAPVTSLTTGNGRRDRDLNASMESDRYPVLRFDLHGVSVTGEAGDSSAVWLSGRLTIHGVTREVGIPAVVHFAAEGIRLRSSFPLNLRDYGIGGLSRMMGLLKMHPDIVVRVDLLFAPGASAEPPADARGGTPPPSG